MSEIFMFSNLIVFFVLMILIVLIPAIMGVVVFLDAKKMGMEPIPWTIVVMLVPMFLGLLAYIYVRSQQSSYRCPSCNRVLKLHFKTCPYCAMQLTQPAKGV